MKVKRASECTNSVCLPNVSTPDQAPAPVAAQVLDLRTSEGQGRPESQISLSLTTVINARITMFCRLQGFKCSESCSLANFSLANYRFVMSMIYLSLPFHFHFVCRISHCQLLQGFRDVDGLCQSVPRRSDHGACFCVVETLISFVATASHSTEGREFRRRHYFLKIDLDS